MIIYSKNLIVNTEDFPAISIIRSNVNYDKYSTINNKELVEQTRLNTFTNLGVPIKLNLAYRTERLAVIPT